jgi:hypothetical protein
MVIGSILYIAECKNQISKCKIKEVVAATRLGEAPSRSRERQLRNLVLRSEALLRRVVFDFCPLIFAFIG